MRGSVVKRGKTWTYILSLGRAPATGRQRQKWVGGFATRRAAEEALTRRPRWRSMRSRPGRWPPIASANGPSAS